MDKKIVGSLVVLMLISLMGCAMKNERFLAHQQETKRIAESFIGKPFIEYLEVNPEIHSHVPDGSGGYMYTVIVDPPMYAGFSYAVVASETAYGRYYIRFYVDAAGIVKRVHFETRIRTVTKTY